ncbi:unnamed protein product [Auanema sp. JU1783]|nr:unnamed protein product [Auanema sp. JU1783]
MSNATHVSRNLIDDLQLLNTSAYIITIIIGVCGNIWVAWKVGIVLMFDRTYTVPRQIMYCILFICVADLLVLVDLILLVHFRLVDQWLFGGVVCKIFYGIEVVNKFVIPLGLVQISRVSYRAVLLHSSKKHMMNCYHRTACVIALASIFVLMVFVSFFAETNTYKLSRKGSSIHITVCNFNPPQYYQAVFNLLAFVVGYIMTSASYVYFYLNVPIILRRRYSTIQTNQACTRLNDHSLTRVRRTVTAFVVVYLACWTPYWTLFWFLSFVNIVNRWIVIISTFTHLLPYVSCTAYPIILTAMNKSIRRAHSNIIDNKKKQFLTIRQGALQAMSAHMGMVHSWMKDDQQTEKSSRAETVIEMSGVLL